MPTYTYEIEKTGERFEVKQSMGDKVFTTLGEVPEYKGDNPDGKIQRIITGGGGFKMDGKFNSMSGLSKRADLSDHLQEIKSVHDRNVGKWSSHGWLYCPCSGWSCSIKYLDV